LADADTTAVNAKTLLQKYLQATRRI